MLFRMKKLSLKKKLWLCCGSLLGILLLVGGIGYESARTTEALVRTVQFNVRKQGLSAAIELAVEREKVGGRDALLHSDSKYLDDAREDFRQQTATLEPLLSTPQGRELFAQIKSSEAAYAVLWTKLFNFMLPETMPGRSRPSMGLPLSRPGLT